MSTMPKWAKWHVSAKDSEFDGPADYEFYEYISDVRNALEVVFIPMVAVNQLLDHLPPKVGESNHVTVDNITVTVTRLKEY